MTQAELGKAVGLSSAQISRLEKGERALAVPWMERLARALGCQPAELLAPRHEAVGPSPPGPAEGAPFDYADPVTVQARPWPIPFWGEGAGFCPHGCMYFDQELMERFDLNPALCKVLRINDTSMEPALFMGSVCLLDQRRTDIAEIPDGEICAFDTGKFPLIRRLRLIGESQVLTAEDPTEPYQSWHDGLPVLGRIVWTARLFNLPRRKAA